MPTASPVGDADGEAACRSGRGGRHGGPLLGERGLALQHAVDRGAVVVRLGAHRVAHLVRLRVRARVRARARVRVRVRVSGAPPPRRSPAAPPGSGWRHPTPRSHPRLCGCADGGLLCGCADCGRLCGRATPCAAWRGSRISLRSSACRWSISFSTSPSRGLTLWWPRAYESVGALLGALAFVTGR